MENANRNTNEEIISVIISFLVLYIKSEKDEELETKIIIMLKSFGSNEDACKSYPEISQIVYNLTANDLNFLKIFFGLNDAESLNEFSGFLDQYKELQETKINSNLRHFEKHIKLSCYQREYMDKISRDATQRVTEIKKDMKDTTAAVNEARTNAKEASSYANEAREKIVSKVEKVYSEFTTILGIFTAITFATFGGLQLLGNVFGSIKNITHVSIGSTIMLGSIYLIGTYLILVALLTGIAKLGDKKYIVSFPMRDALLGAFIAMFLFGFAYSNYHFLLNFIDNFWFKNYYFNFSLILFTFLICVFLPGILDMLIYRRISNKTKDNSLRNE